MTENGCESILSLSSCLCISIEEEKAGRYEMKEERFMENEEKTEKKEDGTENAYYSAKPRFGSKGPSKIRQQFSRGIAVFLIVAASILFYFALLRLTDRKSVV